MRDIRPEGDLIVNGDLTVNEGDQGGFIPFEEMNREQLQGSLQHHQKLAKQERSRINNFSFKLLGVAIIIGLILSVWYFINDGLEDAMFFIGLIGVGMPIALAVKGAEQRSEFEQRQINTVNYIITLIRELR